MRIAVIGSGISGLGAAWLLSEKFEVHLYESEDRLGGHANTVDVPEGDKSVPIDTGFLVYNELTYPNLIGFFDALGVKTVDSDMSLSIISKIRNIEWAGNNLNSVFGQRKNLFSAGFLRMLLDIFRFAREAEENLSLSRRHAWNLGELLEKRRYSTRFIEDYLLPIGGAIWSTPEAGMKAFPAETFLVFFMNHKLLEVNGRPKWRTVEKGSREYVKKAATKISKIFLSSPVTSVERVSGKVRVTSHNRMEEYDKVILATHAPVTKKILKDQNPREEEILRTFQTESNATILHRDENFMPVHRRCWSSWNVMATGSESKSKVSLTYFINSLQPLPTKSNFFVTLNPHDRINSPLREFQYEHPLFDQNSIRAQRQLPEIQGNGGVYFAGAWTRYGFHEDGILSAVKVAELLGVIAPWNKKEIS